MVYGVRYDDSRWPVVRITMPAARVTGAALQDHLARIASYHERGSRFGLLFDLRRAALTGAEDRRLIARRMRLDAEQYPGRLTGCAVVLASALQRGAVKALTWMANPGYPIEVFSDPQAAERWLEMRLADAPPPAVLRG